MIKIIFKDLYESFSSVTIDFAEQAGKMHEVISDFREITGDEISDESAFLVARRFLVYVKRIGYPARMNAPEDAQLMFQLDLPSGNITSSTSLGELGEELHIPTASEISREPFIEETPINEFTPVDETEQIQNVAPENIDSELVENISREEKV